MTPVVPGPRPADEIGGSASFGAGPAAAVDHPRVALARTGRGWTVIPLAPPADGERVADLVEGMTLADLVAEELGGLPEPDRNARRSARGVPGTPADVDPVDARVAALERTVAQLEHALAARVSTERAIGVLAERNGSSPRTAFEELRGQARTQGRPVVELAREVLDGLAADPAPGVVAPPPAAGARRTPAPRSQPAPPAAVVADGRS
ncbi:transcription antitermination regulator [Blastococcus sp. TBT05-19]|uniref:ANTAR domain-containing protein n=1 Tax=Blastococcus sp. TBT05-19 TaxID=2250581 RepID=UPI000DE9485C|nr:ANTAR domain-containing protein [Blastococcus sp. TBT05-19]RBY91830.1 transcription antitermination regulator [Blastococcus sp. TBT05-19]